MVRLFILPCKANTASSYPKKNTDFSNKRINLTALSIRLDFVGILTIILVIMSKQAFSLIYAPIIKSHLRAIDRKYPPQIGSTIKKQLEFNPDVRTRNRKPLKQPTDFGATWELRFGPHNQFRVFYDIKKKSHEVHILAIGIKKRNRLLIGRKEVKL